MSKKQSKPTAPAKPPVVDVKALIQQAKDRAAGVKDSITDISSTIQAALNYSPEADPLADVEYGQGIEKDCEQEASALLKGFQQRAEQERDRFMLAVDSEFWFAVCFQSREQKEMFLAFTGWLTLGDKYIDGTQLAKKLGLELPEVVLSNKKAKPDKRLLPLVRQLK